MWGGFLLFLHKMHQQVLEYMVLFVCSLWRKYRQKKEPRTKTRVVVLQCAKERFLTRTKMMKMRLAVWIFIS